MNSIRIETSIRGGVIVNEITGPELDWRTNARQVIARELMNTKDAQVREALIRMGWTPPQEPVAQKISTVHNPATGSA